VSRHIYKKPEARLDLVQHFVYIGENNLGAARRFLKAVADDLQKLATMPGMGRMREFRRADLHRVRSWPVSGFENYLIFYEATDERLDVLRVLHGARDIDRIFEEERA
jgi:toxin ParE1/3/4